MPLRTLENSYLADSNSYFRLAKSLHPLLCNPFGKKNHCIFILRECDEEYSNSLSLQNKFSWVKSDEFSNNRKKGLLRTSSYDDAIENNIKFIKLYAREKYINVSQVDIKYLASALELGIVLITDDSGMIKIAEEFEIKIMKSIDVLKLMLDCNYITIEKVKEVTSYWVHTKDTPKDFKVDCSSLFGLKY